MGWRGCFCVWGTHGVVAYGVLDCVWRVCVRVAVYRFRDVCFSCGVSRGGASGERAELRSRVDGLTADKRRLGAVADELRQGVCPLACGRVDMCADCGCVLASVM